jgi:hypothetical protein
LFYEVVEKMMTAKLCNVFVTLLFGLIFLLEGYAQVVEMSSQYGTVDVLGGEYRVHNNVWGASTPQTIEVDQSSTYFKVISSGHNNTGGVPASYPFILKGSHFGGAPTSVNNPLPVPVPNISSAPFTWSINTAYANGTWDAALDIWFGQGSTNNLEMMIWINYKGGCTPAGTKLTTVKVGGFSWDIYYGSPVLSYKITSVRDSVQLDIKNFINDAVSRGILNTSWNLLAIEAGFEIWIDGTNLTSKSFSTSVVQGLTTMITSPTNGATFAAPANITINATAAKTGGSISKVEFFEGSNKIGESTSNPYTFTWNNIGVGNYKLTTKATDVSNTSAISDTIYVSVIPIVYGTSMEAENLILTNYLVESNAYASGGKCIKLSSARVTGDAIYNFNGTTGRYNIQVWYFDENDGACTFRVFVNGTKVDEWIASQNFGSPNADALTRTSRIISNISIAYGNEIKLEAVQDASENGRFDNVVITGVTSVEQQAANSQPAKYELLQNYPNPFNPQTAIKFGVSSPCQIELSVYNLLGIKVARLAQGVYQPGNYQVQFDASGLSSGIYIYRLTTSTKDIMKKCLLLK